ncbi:MAG: DUF1294 domain-containing protein [Clostridia bacterium]|nr:DUF1294 domain-containing protein [Clostridia bacterium]
MKLFLTYILLISAVSVLVTIWDKKAARRHAMRVPESVLLLLAALGGSVSMYVTMLVIRHKTRHPKFMFGIPAIFVLQISLLLFLTWRFEEGLL